MSELSKRHNKSNKKKSDFALCIISTFYSIAFCIQPIIIIEIIEYSSLKTYSNGSLVMPLFLVKSIKYGDEFNDNFYH